MRALVTGAAGFLGANLIRHLRSRGHEAIGVCRPSTAPPWRLEDLGEGVGTIELDLRDSAAIERVLAAVKPNWVFHLAAHGAYSWQTDAHAMIDINVRATAVLLAASQTDELRAFINVGSSSEYGLKSHAPREDEWLQPNSCYAATKAAGSHITALAAAQGAPAVTLRLYSIYGPWEDPGRLIPAIVREATRSRLPALAQPRIARDFVYVKDCCDALLSAAELGAPGGPGAVLNIGSGTQTDLGELVEVARRELGVRALPEWESMSQRAWDTNVWVSDPSSARKLLGWKTSTGLGDGLRRTAAWLLDRPRLWERYGVEAWPERLCSDLAAMPG